MYRFFLPIPEIPEVCLQIIGNQRRIIEKFAIVNIIFVEIPEVQRISENFPETSGNSTGFSCILSELETFAISTLFSWKFPNFNGLLLKVFNMLTVFIVYHFSGKFLKFHYAFKLLVSICVNGLVVIRDNQDIISVDIQEIQLGFSKSSR